MNNRIKELAEQCYHRYSEHNIDLEKFAELIVQVCANICDSDDDTARILDAFGVEE